MRRASMAKTKYSFALASETALEEQVCPIIMRSVGSRSSGQYTSANTKAEPHASSRTKGCRPFSAVTVAVVSALPLKVRP